MVFNFPHKAIASRHDSSGKICVNFLHLWVNIGYTCDVIVNFLSL